jgi:hypothetical protein
MFVSSVKRVEQESWQQFAKDIEEPAKLRGNEYHDLMTHIQNKTLQHE